MTDKRHPMGAFFMRISFVNYGISCADPCGGDDNEPQRIKTSPRGITRTRRHAAPPKSRGLTSLIPYRGPAKNTLSLTSFDMPFLVRVIRNKLQSPEPKKPSPISLAQGFCGERGIRTPGTVSRTHV